MIYVFRGNKQRSIWTNYHLVFLYQKCAIYWGRRLIIYLTFLILTLYKCVVCYTIVVARFEGKTPLKFKKSRNFVNNFPLHWNLIFWQIVIFGSKKRATTSKTVKAPVKVAKNKKKCLEAKQKMWFVVKVPKIENGARGMKSGAGVWGEVGNLV